MEDFMRYSQKEQLAKVARVRDRLDVPRLSRVERLKRWANLLQEEAHRPLQTLLGTEWEEPEVRDALRADQSPISIAWADPLLRSEGLMSDRYGAAKDFFGITDKELHRVLCYCHFGATVSGSRAARSVRRIVRAAEGRGVGGRLRSLLGRSAIQS
jgi:hypothetical protein